MASDGGLDIFAKWRRNFAKLIKLPSSFANLKSLFFMVLAKFLRCQVLLANCWSCYPISRLTTEVSISNSLLKHLLSHKFWQINDKNSLQQFAKYVCQKPRLAILLIRARTSTRADSPRISSPRRSLLRAAAARWAAAVLAAALLAAGVLLPCWAACCCCRAAAAELLACCCLL